MSNDWNAEGPIFDQHLGAATFPTAPDAVPTTEIRSGAYRVAFARDGDELDQALRLRFSVFNRELSQGLAESETTGRDEDAFDAVMHHLLVWHEPSGEVVGTYRMQTARMAASNIGFYTAGEFDLAGVGPSVAASMVEIGRACISKPHRRGRVLHLLWKGLAAYLTWNRMRYLFGCCSLTGTDPAVGWAAYERLRADGRTHPVIHVEPTPGKECRAGGVRPEDVKIPILFRSYLQIGATVCSPPSIDALFGTTDFLVVLDTETLPSAVRSVFFQ